MVIASGGETPITPNEAFRRVRKIYVLCIAAALPLLFLAFYTSVQNIGFGVLPVVLLIAGVGLLLFSMLTRAAAACPRCSSSLLWKKGPIGTGRLSLGEKSHCPECGLDLNVPWVPEPIGDEDAALPASEKEANTP